MTSEPQRWVARAPKKKVVVLVAHDFIDDDLHLAATRAVQGRPAHGRVRGSLIHPRQAVGGPSGGRLIGRSGRSDVRWYGMGWDGMGWSGGMDGWDWMKLDEMCVGERCFHDVRWTCKATRSLIDWVTWHDPYRQHPITNRLMHPLDRSTDKSRKCKTASAEGLLLHRQRSPRSGSLRGPKGPGDVRSAPPWITAGPLGSCCCSPGQVVSMDMNLSMAAWWAAAWAAAEETVGGQAVAAVPTAWAAMARAAAGSQEPRLAVAP